jgi:CelD/BcsL family acetyltransferase involved in cellulose biosynthesis
LRIREAQDFVGLKDEWNRLLKKNLLGDNIFLTWEWLSTWWNHFGEGRKPLILIVEDGSEILGIAPLMLSKYKLPGFGSVKKIEFIATRHSDYNNFIILKKERDCLGVIMNYLKDNVADWDWIELKEIPETTENLDFLEALFPDIPGLKSKKRVCNVCPYVSLPNSFNLLMERLNRKIRKNIKYYLKKIKENYRVELKRYDETSFSVKDTMRTFIKLHEARWATEGLPGSFKSKEAAFRNFHMDVAEIFAKKGWLGVYFLTADYEPFSVLYTFEYSKRCYHYLSGFDPNYSDYSAGNLIIRFLLERLIKNGFIEYDMMRGDEPYKLMWTNTTRRNFEIRFQKKGWHPRTGLYNWVMWDNTIGNLAAKLKLSLRRRYI